MASSKNSRRTSPAAGVPPASGRPESPGEPVATGVAVARGAGETVAAILQYALRERASDIHLDPAGDGDCAVRFRIDGALQEGPRLEGEVGAHVRRALKSNAGLDPGLATGPQDGRGDFDVGGRRVSVRVAACPTIAGEKLAIRILVEGPARLRLTEIGLRGRDQATIEEAIRDATGMIVASGPTGCGKTTTLYALLEEMAGQNRVVITIEDPVEYPLRGVSQIQVNERQGLDFAAGVKGLLRLDPDVIFMGEMREPSAARAAMDAAHSGHVFLTSLHARDAAGTVTALRNFGVADADLAALLDLVVAQRLVRRLCKGCRQHQKPSHDESAWLRRLGVAVPDRLWHPKGCPECGGSGYRGRIGIFEVWRLQEDDTDLLVRHVDEATLRRHLRGRGQTSLLDDTVAKVLDGTTSLAELRAGGGFGFFHAPERRP